ncbi:hypothetical protein ADUPG1_008530, partial [Aduncisulcus paluster]
MFLLVLHWFLAYVSPPLSYGNITQLDIFISYPSNLTPTFYFSDSIEELEDFPSILEGETSSNSVSISFSPTQLYLIRYLLVGLQNIRQIDLNISFYANFSNHTQESYSTIFSIDTSSIIVTSKSGVVSIAPSHLSAIYYNDILLSHGAIYPDSLGSEGFDVLSNSQLFISESSTFEIVDDAYIMYPNGQGSTESGYSPSIMVNSIRSSESDDLSQFNTFVLPAHQPIDEVFVLSFGDLLDGLHTLSVSMLYSSSLLWATVVSIDSSSGTMYLSICMISDGMELEEKLCDTLSSTSSSSQNLLSPPLMVAGYDTSLLVFFSLLEDSSSSISSIASIIWDDDEDISFYSYSIECTTDGFDTSRAVIIDSYSMCADDGKPSHLILFQLLPSNEDLDNYSVTSDMTDEERVLWIDDVYLARTRPLYESYSESSDSSGSSSSLDDGISTPIVICQFHGTSSYSNISNDYCNVITENAHHAQFIMKGNASQTNDMISVHVVTVGNEGTDLYKVSFDTILWTQDSSSIVTIKDIHSYTSSDCFDGSLPFSVSTTASEGIGYASILSWDTNASVVSISLLQIWGEDSEDASEDCPLILLDTCPFIGWDRDDNPILRFSSSPSMALELVKDSLFVAYSCNSPDNAEPVKVHTSMFSNASSDSSNISTLEITSFDNSGFLPLGPSFVFDPPFSTFDIGATLLPTMSHIYPNSHTESISSSQEHMLFCVCYHYIGVVCGERNDGGDIIPLKFSSLASGSSSIETIPSKKGNIISSNGYSTDIYVNSSPSTVYSVTPNDEYSSLGTYSSEIGRVILDTSAPVNGITDIYCGYGACSIVSQPVNGHTTILERLQGDWNEGNLLIDLHDSSWSSSYNDLNVDMFFGKLRVGLTNEQNIFIRDLALTDITSMYFSLEVPACDIVGLTDITYTITNSYYPFLNNISVLSTDNDAPISFAATCSDCSLVIQDTDMRKSCGTSSDPESTVYIQTDDVASLRECIDSLEVRVMYNNTSSLTAVIRHTNEESSSHTYTTTLIPVETITTFTGIDTDISIIVNESECPFVDTEIEITGLDELSCTFSMNAIFSSDAENLGISACDDAALEYLIDEDEFLEYFTFPSDCSPSDSTHLLSGNVNHIESCLRSISMYSPSAIDFSVCLIGNVSVFPITLRVIEPIVQIEYPSYSIDLDESLLLYPLSFVSSENSIVISDISEPNYGTVSSISDDDS